MDESAAGLDPQAEAAAFTRARGGRRRHRRPGHPRRSSAITADCVYVLDDGRIIEQGTYRELIAHDGEYAIVFALQAAAYHATPDDEAR